MQNTNKQLVIDQLDSTLKKFNSVKHLFPPRNGWIKAIRSALGMSSKQLAKRLGVSTQRMSFLEHNETTGAVTIETMRKAAEQLDCFFVYGIVPKQTLKNIVIKRATHIAKKIIKQSSQTMLLEQQNISKQEEKKMLKDKVEELTSKIPSYLWEKI